MINTFKKILVYSANPPTIFYPFPLVPILIVSFIGGSLQDFAFIIVFTALFYSGLNLWNHINDYMEDYKAGKDTPFIEKKIRVVVKIYVFFSYILSITIYMLRSNSILGKFAFAIVSTLTFLYSDNTITKLRLKKHYITELLTYFICAPAFVMALYDLVKPIDCLGISFAFVLFPFLISTVFLKDLKDISEDKEAGFKTLGVVFDVKFLIKIFFLLNIIFYILFSLFLFKYLQKFYIISILYLFIPLYGYINAHRNNWDINSRLIKNIQITIYSGFLFILLFIILFYFK